MLYGQKVDYNTLLHLDNHYKIYKIKTGDMFKTISPLKKGYGC